MSRENYNQRLFMITAISSVIIASCSFILAFYQSCQIQYHNELSVKPMINILRIHIIDSSIEKAGLYIQNNGLGPAIIDKVILKIDDINYSITEKKGWRPAAEVLGINENWIQWSGIRYGYVIRSQDQIPIFTILRNPKNELEKTALYNALKNTDIKVRFRSLYEKKYDFLFPSNNASSINN